jgi:hypothetical protein
MKVRTDRQSGLSGAPAATNRADLISNTIHDYSGHDVFISKIVIHSVDPVGLTPLREQHELAAESPHFFIIPVTIPEATASAPHGLEHWHSALTFKRAIREVEGWWSERDSAITSLEEWLEPADIFDTIAELGDLADLQYNVSHTVSGIVFEMDVDLANLPERTVEVGDWDFEPWDD